VSLEQKVMKRTKREKMAFIMFGICIFVVSFCATRAAKNESVLACPKEEPGGSADPKIYCRWIKLEIESEKSTYKVGEPIIIKYKIKNATKNLTLQLHVEYRRGRAVAFKVRPSGSMTDLPETAIAGLPKISGGGHTFDVGPEGEYARSYLISSARGWNSSIVVPSNQFDMSEPRTYKVSAHVNIPYSLGDGAAGGGLARKTSNTIEIKVVE
jgi:hypothetical protein